MTRADKRLVAVLVFLALAATPVAGMRHAAAAAGGAVVVVKHPGGVLRMPIDRDDTCTVQGLCGRVVVVVRDGAVRVVHSSCRDQICVRSGSIAYPGDAIACVPNGVVVAIEGVGSDGLDALVR